MYSLHAHAFRLSHLGSVQRLESLEELLELGQRSLQALGLARAGDDFGELGGWRGEEAL